MKPIHYAAARGHVDVIRFLLDKGAFATALNRHQKTPLHYAVEGKHPEAIKVLMAHGARPDKATDTLPAPIECTQDDALRGIMTDPELMALSLLYQKQWSTHDPRRSEIIRQLQALALGG